MKRISALTMATVLGLTAPSLANAQQAHAGKMVKYTVNLRGDREVGHRGPAAGHGTATITINNAKRKLCYSISVQGIDLPAIAAHIETGRAGANGLVAVSFVTAPATNGKAKGCVSPVLKKTYTEIEANPSGYYLNIHTKKYRNGAVRGQL